MILFLSTYFAQENVIRDENKMAQEWYAYNQQFYNDSYCRNQLILIAKIVIYCYIYTFEFKLIFHEKNYIFYTCDIIVIESFLK